MLLGDTGLPQLIAFVSVELILLFLLLRLLLWPVQWPVAAMVGAEFSCGTIGHKMWHTTKLLHVYLSMHIHV